MTGPVQDVLPGMPTDPAPESDPVPVGSDEPDPRALIAAAITEAAKHRRDLVHISAVRRHLSRNVPPSCLGTTFNTLARRGVLVKTGRYEENGDNRAKARNASKASPVWRLMRPINPEDYR